MKPGLVLKHVLLVVASACTVTAQAATMWNEGSGDLSSDPAAPTSLLMTIGSNVVIGSTGTGALGFDPDYFRFTVPANAVLTSIIPLNNTSVSGGSSFIGINDGVGIAANDILGFKHYDTADIDTNILPAMGLTHPLPSGVYTVWVQELGGTVDYGFNFMTTAVPEPSGWLLLVAGLAGTLAYSRRRMTLRRAPL